jgi:hypothetical protein
LIAAARDALVQIDDMMMHIKKQGAFVPGEVHADGKGELRGVCQARRRGAGDHRAHQRLLPRPVGNHLCGSPRHGGGSWRVSTTMLSAHVTRIAVIDASSASVAPENEVKSRDTERFILSAPEPRRAYNAWQARSNPCK